MRGIKKEIRIVGIDDGFFNEAEKYVIVVGTIFRGGLYMDGLLSTYVEVDGLDGTEKIANMINSSRHKKQLKVIMLDGITLAGFNMIDIKELYEKTGIPIIVINRKLPNLEKIKKALENFHDYEKRLKIIENAGPIKKFSKIYYQSIGIEEEKTKEVISISSTRSYIPEPLRVAHLIATGISKGESKGRA